MRIRPFGECGALIEFDSEVSPFVHDRVTKLYKMLAKERIVGINNMIPAYHSITISFDHRLTFTALEESIKRATISAETEDSPVKTFKMPVCYDPEFGIDQRQVASRLGLIPEEVITIHHSHTYRLFCIGFIPGFLYLGSLPTELTGKRLKEPRKSVPAGSVGIAGQQTGIYPASSPGGWEVLGRCPVPTFLPYSTRPVPFEVGDSIEFFPVSRKEYEEWRNRKWDEEQYQNLVA